MRNSNLLAAAVIAMLMGAALWADGPATKPHSLPADATMAVLTLDRTGGMRLHKNPDPAFEILSDGTAIVGDPFGIERRVKGKLTPDQIQDLLHYILDEEKFADITPADLQMPGNVMVGDATTTNISVNYDDTGHHCQAVAVEMVAQLTGKDSPATRLVKIAARIDAVSRVVALGGDDAVKKLLDAANAKLKTDLPAEAPMQASDLANARALPDGSDVATFSRKTVLPNGQWHISEARVTGDGKGNIDAKVEKGADQPAEVGK
jgi:hypothetical protein